MARRPLETYLLILLHLLLSISALYGGACLVYSPGGQLLGMDINWLKGSGFSSYFIPGVILFLFNGVLPLLVAVGLLWEPQWQFFNVINIYPNRHWAWAYSVYVGVICISWIVIQQLLTTYFILQPIVAATGLLIIVLTLMPRTMQQYKVL